MRNCWGATLPSVIVVCLPMLGMWASAAEVVTVPDGAGTWEMVIAPGDRPGDDAEATGVVIVPVAYQEEVDERLVPQPLEPEAPAHDASPSMREGGVVDPMAYWFVYRSIPFLRTEYEANPSYRHEATMEFLFGQLRPTVIHRHQAVGPPAPVVEPAFLTPWVYDIYLGQIPTFLFRYVPPAIPWGTPLSW